MSRSVSREGVSTAVSSGCSRVAIWHDLLGGGVVRSTWYQRSINLTDAPQRATRPVLAASTPLGQSALARFTTPFELTVAG